MKKKFLSLALVLALCLSLCPWAMAADSRETDFFEEQPHTELTFDEIEYKAVDAEAVLAAAEEIRALMADEANEAVIAEKFAPIMDQFMEQLTMYSLVNIQVSQDAANEAYANAYMEATTNYLVILDAVCALMRDLLASPCAGFLTEQLTEEDIAYYSTYEDMTEEEAARAQKENELLLTYQNAALQPYTVEQDGQTYDMAALDAALADGTMYYETYDALLTELFRVQNAALGEIYLELVALRQEGAKAAGYDNYGDYAYAEMYGRDYTQESIQPFFEAVKAHMVDANSTFTSLYTYGLSAPVFTEDYSDVEQVLDLTEGYIGQMSGEMAEAYTYMREHKMYDLAYSDAKQAAGFSTMLYTYGAPFMYNQPYGDVSDFITLFHEFGHYNQFYWSPCAWNDSVVDNDSAEVHSQGLEMLMTHYYPELFGDGADAVMDYHMANIVYTIVSACEFAELEQFVYTTPDVTLDQINHKYRELQKAYGFVPVDEPVDVAYGWFQIHHLFDQPSYYISYAVSAAGALEFWLAAQEGEFLDTVDKYLAFVALPAGTGFLKSFEELGMANPLDPAYIESLANELLTRTRAEERLPGLMLASAFSDLSGSHWFDEYVLTLVMAGVIDGYDDGTFRADSEVTWGQGLKLVLELVGYADIAPVEGGTWASGYEAKALELGLIDAGVELNASITRAEISALLCKALGIPASENASPFADEADGYAVALAEAGVIDGFTAEDGTATFQGADSLTRAQLCAILYRAANLAAEAPAEDAAA